MNVSPVNSNPTIQNNNGFKSRFIFNTAIHEVVETSGKPEIARFKNVLSAMEKIDDGLLFWLQKRVGFYKLNNENIGYVIKYNLFKQKGTDEGTKELVASLSSSTSDFTHNKLSLITKAIESHYSEIAEVDSKTELKDKIYNMMA